MKAMVMAAGVGSRLMPLTSTIPKPMVPIVNRPVMEYCIRLLKNHGIRNIIANTHYMPDVITEYFSDGKDFGVDLTYSYEKTLLGTAGGVKNNSWFLDDTFFVISGDALTNINLTEMYNFHKEKKALVTLALKPVKDVTQYGVVVTDKNNKINAFQEKPKKNEALSNLVNTGIYIFEPQIFEYIPDGFYDFGKELFPKLVSMNEEIYGYMTNDYWCDVGNLNVYRQANWEVLSGKYKLDGHKVKAIDDRVKIEQIHNDLENAILGSNCYIGKNVSLRNCILWGNCIVEDNVSIENAVIGSNCLIGSNTVVNANVVIGCGSVIGKNVFLNKGITIAAKSNVTEGNIVKENIAG